MLELIALIRANPNLTKVIVMLILDVALSCACFYQGYTYAQTKEKALHEEQLAKVLKEAKKQAEIDSAAALKAQSERDLQEQKASQLQKELSDLMRGKKVYSDCKIDKDVKNKINEALR